MKEKQLSLRLLLVSAAQKRAEEPEQRNRRQKAADGVCRQLYEKERNEQWVTEKHLTSFGEKSSLLHVNWCRKTTRRIAYGCPGLISAPSYSSPLCSLHLQDLGNRNTCQPTYPAKGGDEGRSHILLDLPSRSLPLY